MSTCISSHGEFGSHTSDGRFGCTRCGVFDEDAALAELDKTRGERDDAQHEVFTLKNSESLDTVALAAVRAELTQTAAELDRVTAELATVNSFNEMLTGEIKKVLPVVEAAKAWRARIIGDREYRTMALDQIACALVDAVDALAGLESTPPAKIDEHAAADKDVIEAAYALAEKASRVALPPSSMRGCWSKLMALVCAVNSRKALDDQGPWALEYTPDASPFLLREQLAVLDPQGWTVLPEGHPAESDMIEAAYGLIAAAWNVGDPPVEPVPGWNDAATRFRTWYHAWLDNRYPSTPDGAVSKSEPSGQDTQYCVFVDKTSVGGTLEETRVRDTLEEAASDFAVLRRVEPFPLIMFWRPPGQLSWEPVPAGLELTETAEPGDDQFKAAAIEDARRIAAAFSVPPGVRFPNAWCAEPGGIHRPHLWGDPSHWCDGEPRSPVPAAGASEPVQ